MTREVRDAIDRERKRQSRVFKFVATIGIFALVSFGFLQPKPEAQGPVSYTHQKGHSLTLSPPTAGGPRSSTNSSAEFSYPHILPDVVWLMSFGGSGTSYTIRNVESMTGASTASNYGGEADYSPLRSVNPRSVQGPFIRSMSKPLPRTSILTKTHCGGYCIDCHPKRYVFEQVEDFERLCRTSHITEGGSVQEVVYSPAIPKRAVHLIRSPFDNIIGRFHLNMKHRRDRENAGIFSDALNSSMVANNSSGFSLWCGHLDKKYRDEEAKRGSIFSNRVLSVPCHAEWIRYIAWHNHATSVTESLNMSVHYLWYENYTQDFEKTVRDLFSFLQLETPYDPSEWNPGHSYSDYFDVETISLPAIHLMRSLATKKTWQLIEHYMTQFLH